MMYWAALFILGLVVGSFLNVCIHRLPRGESIVFPPSHCPDCGHKLGAVDLIPIAGYLILRGKCRYCKAPIALRYPLVELLSGISFIAVALAFPPDKLPLDFFFCLLFSCLALVIFFIDLEHQVIPDALSLSMVALGLLFNYLKGSLLASFYGLILGFILLWLIAFAGKAWFKKEAMGEGDYYLAAGLGAYLGWVGVLLSIFLSYVLAAAVALVFMAAGRVKMGQYVPFGPALAAGGLITLFFGQQIITWYLSLFL